MSKLTQISSKTIIIHPGSSLLRIGLAVDRKPNVFLNCIARNSIKPMRIKATTPLSSYEKIQFPASNEYENAQNKFHLGNFHIDDSLYKVLNNSEPHTAYSNHAHQWTPFLRGFRQAGNGTYEIEWPISAGHFNELFSPTNTIQNLEDMWTHALENYLDIPKESFNKYSAILIIEDIFIRREVRQMIDMLFRGLGLSRVVVQLTSVCVTYGVGLPSACVVDLGFQKTSITCVDEGVSPPDVRVALPVGVSDCMRAFHAATKHYVASDDSELSVSLENLGYETFEDTKTLFNALFDYDLAAAKLLQGLKPEKESQNETENQIEVTIRKHKLRLPITAALVAHLSPYFPPKGQMDLAPTYQVPAIDAPEPDDPFDEVYIATTAREKKRRLPAGDALLSKGDDGVSDLKIPRIQKPSAFKDIAEAVLWSINQVASVPASELTAAVAPSSSTAAAATTTQQQQNLSDEKAVQLRQRMLGCILLVGGGATNLGGQLLERRLHEELQKLAGNCGCPVEVILRPEGVADLAWEGAKLMLNTDSIGDLWISAADWRRYGARVMRERAPFPW